MKLLISLISIFGLYQSASAVIVRSAYQQNLCLDVNANEQAGWRFGKNVEVWNCNGNSNQQFGLQLASVSGNTTNFTIQTLGKCLDVDLGYQDTWTHNNNVQIFDCNGGINQQFRLESRNDGWFIIRSALDGRCLDIDLNTANGWRFEHNVQLWGCSGESNQLWKFEANGGNGDIIIIPTAL